MNRVKRRAIHLIFIVLLFAGPVLAQAKQIVLFRNAGEPVSDYNHLVRMIEPGDELIFSDSRSYLIRDVIMDAKKAGTTIVLGLNDQRVLRIPSQRGKGLLIYGTIPDFITWMIDGYQMLRETGARSVKVYLDESIPRERILVDRLTIVEELDDFFARVADWPIEKILEIPEGRDFIEFSRSFWAFRNVGDLIEAQVVYSREFGWVLLDWTRNHGGASFIDDGTIFRQDAQEMIAASTQARNGMLDETKVNKLEPPNQLRKLVNEVIEEERLKRGLAMRPSFCDRLIQGASWVLKQLKKIGR